jgi:hypothetical protein
MEKTSTVKKQKKSRKVLVIRKIHSNDTLLSPFTGFIWKIGTTYKDTQKRFKLGDILEKEELIHSGFFHVSPYSKASIKRLHILLVNEGTWMYRKGYRIFEALIPADAEVLLGGINCQCASGLNGHVSILTDTLKIVKEIKYEEPKK